MEKLIMKKLLAALLFSTPLAVALPAAAKFQSFGSQVPAAEEGDKDKATPDQEKKEFQVSEDDQNKDKATTDQEKKEFQVSDDNDSDKDKMDKEKKEFQVSDDNDQDKSKSDEKKEFQA
jgi:hypothetical protein